MDTINQSSRVKNLHMALITTKYRNKQSLVMSRVLGGIIMCGITAVFKGQAVEIAPGIIENMTLDISHRGPDDEGIIFLTPSDSHWQSCPGSESGWIVALGSRRLSIRDVSQAGHMPMVYQDNFWIIYNGEVYNSNEIRTELEKQGYTFRSMSDTEVILAAYAAWGTDCFTRFRGMWGLVIFDCTRNEAIICRDRLGIKPLYLWRRPGIVAITSEIKQFLHLPGFIPRMNYPVAAEYLKTGYEDPGGCFFQDVQSIPAGHWLKLSLDTLIPSTPEPYWYPERVQVSITNAEKAAQLFADKLQECMHLYLRSDVPVGCALSGGLDSSTIAVMINHLKDNQDEPLHTFTSTFPNDKTDERVYGDYVVSSIQALPHYVTPDPHTFLEELDQFLYTHDEPVGSLSMYAGYCVARLMREANIPVTLNGQGCDEILSGYWQSYFFYLRQLGRTGRIPSLISHFVGAMMREGNAALISQIPVMLKRYHARSKPTSFIRLRKTQHEEAPPMLQKILALDEQSWRVEGIRSLTLPRLLKWEDRNSMAFSIEGRYPFLDHELIELCLSFAIETLYHGGWTKWPLRLGIGSILPPQICHRRTKLGFEVPQDKWLRGPLAPAIQHWLKQDRPLWEYVEQVDVQQLALQTQHSNNDRMGESGQALFRLFIFDRWVEVFGVKE
jgi:asparagine synthase (glutamine-hydrolysing)